MDFQPKTPSKGRQHRSHSVLRCCHFYTQKQGRAVQILMKEGDFLIKVVWKEDCRYCDLTKKFLSDKGVEYVTEEVTEGNFKEVVVDKYGYKVVPVVVHDNGTFAGWDLAELRKLVDNK